MRLLFLLWLFAFSAQAQTDLEYLVKQEMQQHIPTSQSLRYTKIKSQYDVHHYGLHFSASPDTSLLVASNTIYFTSLEKPMQSFDFDLVESFQVDSVLYHAKKIAYSLERANLYTAMLSNSIGYGVQDSISIYYHGEPPSTGLGSYQRSVVLGNKMIWTLSEPFGASDWWPCKNSLDDKADSVDIYITCPQRYKAISNGLLVNESVADTFITYHYQHHYPIAPYLVAIAIAPYEVYTDYIHFSPTDSMAMINYCIPQETIKAKPVTGALVNVMLLFSNLFGKYPFSAERYGHAQFGWGGGMEHQTTSFIGNWNIDLLTHELAHQWFGDKITCGSWKDIWLNEGFATYLTGLMHERIKVPADFTAWKADQVKFIIKAPEGSVYCSDTFNIQRIFDGRLSYAKGAMVLHMLRYIMGDDSFFKAINNYINDPSLVYSFSYTNKLIDHLEKVYTKKLDWFFSQWFYGEGYPIYTIDWKQTSTGPLHVSLKQKTSSPKVDFFELPVPIRFCGEGKCSTVVLYNTINSQEFDINLPFIADSAVFNPEYDIIAQATLVQEFIDTSNSALVELYPNPTAGQLTIHSLIGLPIANIQILDMLGRTVGAWNSKDSQPMVLLTMDLNYLRPSVYPIQITMTDGRMIKAKFNKIYK
jgi:aminopeptidase N